MKTYNIFKINRLTPPPLKIWGLLASMLIIFNFSYAANGFDCENPNEIEVYNESNTTSVNMAGSDYYFSFSPSDSIGYFYIFSNGDMPSKLELYYENCYSEPIETTFLFEDSNGVGSLNLIIYNLDPQSNYILKVVQNNSNSATFIDLNYMSFSAYAGEFDCNIVINGSFESYLNLGSTKWNGSMDRNIEWSRGWNGPKSKTHSADYYHTNAVQPDSRVPTNKLGTRTAKNGGIGTNAYAGLFSVNTSMNGANTEFREWMTGSLKDYLIPGHEYHVKFYVSLTTKTGFNFDCVAPGLRFVDIDDPNLTVNDINNMTADIQNTTIQTAGGNWVEISGNYIANGTEKYFIIANFLSDNQSLPSNVSVSNSYFYIDEVSVEDLDYCCSNNFTLENWTDVNDLKNMITTSHYSTPTYFSILTNSNQNYIEINGLTLNINGVFNVNENMVFRNCKLIMGKDARINVTKEFRFIGDQERYIKSCNPDKFWDGIYIDGNLGGNIDTRQIPYSIPTTYANFENASNGIVTQGKTKGFIEYFKFDRNNIAFQTNSNFDNSNFNLEIKHSTFNCSGPLIDNNGSPYFPEQSVIIDNYSYINWTNNPRIKINTCEFNGKAGQLFIENSSVKIENSKFQDFNNTYSMPGTSISETAVILKGITTNNIVNNLVEFRLCSFNSNLLSVEIINSLPVLFYGNAQNSYNSVNFNHSTGEPIAGVPNSTFVKASNNYFGNSLNFLNAMLIANSVKIYNVETGFDLLNMISTGISSCTFDLETQTSSNYSSKNNSYSIGISLNNYGIQQSYLNPTNYINGNTIKHAKIGIVANFAQVEINDNTIEDLNDVTAPTTCFPYLPPCPASPAWGIKVNNCEVMITQNKVKNYTNQYGVQPSNNIDITAIEIINSYLFNGQQTSYPWGINCNNVENTGNGIKFSVENNMYSKIYDNKMSDHYYGFVLANNGFLDDVGDINNAAHNAWIGNYGYSKTFSDNSDGSLCTIYTEGGSVDYDPQILIGHATPGNFPFSKNNSASPVVNSGCITRSKIGKPNTKPNHNFSKSGGSGLSNLSPSFSKKPYMVHAADSALMYQKQMTFYRLLKDSALMQSKKWKPFADSMKLTPLGKAVGLSAKNSISTNNSNFDANLVLINPILEKYEKGQRLNATDSANLRLMAMKCPYYDGIAVYQARYVLSAFGETNIVNTCELVEKPKKVISQNGNKSGINNDPLSSNEYFKIFPNPTKNVLNIDFKVNENEAVQIEIIDVMGKVQLRERLNASTFHRIQLNDMNSAIYFYRLIKNDTAIYSGKLIVE